MFTDVGKDIVVVGHTRDVEEVVVVVVVIVVIVVVVTRQSAGTKG